MQRFESQSFEKTLPEAPVVTEGNIFPSFSKERQADILEIVDFCARCLEKYFKDFNIPHIPREKFFVFTKDSVAPEERSALGLYDGQSHTFGVRDDALYIPKVYIHEMIHFIAKEFLPGSRATGYEFSEDREVDGGTFRYIFYQALNEGMTDLMSEEMYSMYYSKIKYFFRGRGGVDHFASKYSDPIIFVQKLITYNALLLAAEERIPEEEAHHKVWSKLKLGYLKNNHEYLEGLLEVFGDSNEERAATVSFVKTMGTDESSNEGIAVLTRALDKKILARR